MIARFPDPEARGRDVPKRTFHSGDDIVSCARREVRDEVEVDRLNGTHDLGAMRPGDPDGNQYFVRTTHSRFVWTADRSLERERREEIERVVRVQNSGACNHVWAGILRRHMDRIEPVLRDALDG